MSEQTTEKDHIERMADALIDLRIPNPLAVGAEHDIEASGIYGWDELQRLAAALAPLFAQAWDEGLRFGQQHWATNYAGVYQNGNPLRQAPNPYVVVPPGPSTTAQEGEGRG